MLTVHNTAELADHLSLIVEKLRVTSSAMVSVDLESGFPLNWGNMVPATEAIINWYDPNYPNANDMSVTYTITSPIEAMMVTEDRPSLYLYMNGDWHIISAKMLLPVASHGCQAILLEYVKDPSWHTVMAAARNARRGD